MSFELVTIINFVIFGDLLIFLVMVFLFRLSWKRKKVQLEQIEQVWKLAHQE